jgi:hypothetical protein
MPRSKVSAFFSVLLVFVSGVAMGAVGYRLYAVRSVTGNGGVPSPPKKSPEEIRKLVVTSLRDKVKLDDQQFTQVQKIYEEQHDAFQKIDAEYHAKVDPIVDPIFKAERTETHQLHEQAVANIKAILRPDQLPLYEKWQADRQADRKRFQEQQPHDHPEGKGRSPMPRPLP